MHKPCRLKINDINPHLICVLCSGYLIDATTIIECLHSFCRSCIVKYLESHKYCPVCDVQVHKTKPLLNIRSDQTLQDIVYKLVPGLFQNEMCRRREFYAKHPEYKSTILEEDRDVSEYSHIYTSDESVSLSLEYYNNNNTSDNKEDVTDTISKPVHSSRRYLRCPAAVSISHLQKLIRAKYGLTHEHRVDILYKNDSLSEDFTLMDVAYIYLWRRKGPLHLTYRIFEVAKHTVKLEVLVDEKKTVIKSETDDNKTWKEVQLQISENGVMSVTNIEETKSLENSIVEVKSEVCITSKEAPSLIEEVKIEENELPAEKVKEIVENIIPKSEAEVILVPKLGKHKLETPPDPSESAPKKPAIPVKTTVKDVQQLSRNHPLKIHSCKIIKTNNNIVTNVANNNVKTTEQETSTSSSKEINSEKNIITTTVTTNSEPIAICEGLRMIPTSTQSSPKYTQANTNNFITTNTSKPLETAKPILNTVTQPDHSIQTSKASIVPKKSPLKVNTPVGYKTLRDPPRAWNPQISRLNMTKSSTSSSLEPKVSEKPAKFFKMRNNVPRYLGNPASGVKPMYQVREVDPKPQTPTSDSVPRKAHVVKVDPKTLRPISEDGASCSDNGPEIKSNTVSIFNPLRTQKGQSCPKPERRPVVTSPTSKKDKLNINFTPPNPFVPNLASHNLPPNQFLYPNFASYDPRLMAYQHLGLSMFYPQPRVNFPHGGLMPGLNFELNKNLRNSYESKDKFLKSSKPESPKVIENGTIESKLNEGGRETKQSLQISKNEHGKAQNNNNNNHDKKNKEEEKKQTEGETKT